MSAARPHRPGRVTTRRRRSSSSALPGWLQAVLMLAGVLAALAVLVWFYQRASRSAAEVDATEAGGLLGAARGAIDEGRYDLAQQRLERVAASDDLSPERRGEVEAMLAEVADRIERKEVRAANMQGDRYLENKLRRYLDDYLEGTPGRPQVRVFLKRCAIFLERWPRHPERDWVERQLTRFEGYVDLDLPPDFADVDWEIEALTRGKPRPYGEAFEILDRFLRTAEGEEQEKGEELRERLVAERAAYHTDRMLQARHDYEQGQVTKAFGWLVEGAIGMGDAEMEREAAEYLLEMPNVEGRLLGYHRDLPEKYVELLENPLIAGYVDEHGLPDSVD